MKRIILISALVTSLFSGCSYKTPPKPKKLLPLSETVWQNREFSSALDSFIIYADSSGFIPNFDFICVQSEVEMDSTKFQIFVHGGAYRFLNDYEKKYEFVRVSDNPYKIYDFVLYKDYGILLMGDFPNKIISFPKNTKLNMMEDVVKVRYPDDYYKYSLNKRSVGPLIYDDKVILLTFFNSKLISSKRVF